MAKDKAKDTLASKIEVFDENLIVRVSRGKTTSGGIVLPDSDKKARIAVIAEVVAAGEGRILDNGAHHPMPCKAGDRILISGQAGLPLDNVIITELGLTTSESQDIFLIRHQDVIGRMKE